MPHYSPYGNYLARLWPLASLALLVLSLSLGIAAFSNSDSDQFEKFLIAAAFPAGLAVLIASNGYGIISPHDGRFRLRLTLFISGGLLTVIGFYLAPNLFEVKRNHSVTYSEIALESAPYIAVGGLMALSIMRLSTRLRRLRIASDAMAVFGASLVIASAFAGWTIASQWPDLGDSIFFSLLLSATSVGFGIVLTTYALRQSGRVKATRLSGVVGSALLAVFAIAGGINLYDLTSDPRTFVPSPFPRSDYLFFVNVLTPLAITALNLRVGMQYSRWPIWIAAVIGGFAVLFGLWVASLDERLEPQYLFVLPGVFRYVSGFVWVWLATSLIPMSITLYAIFCIEEPWQWLWERMRSQQIDGRAGRAGRHLSDV